MEKNIALAFSGGGCKIIYYYKFLRLLTEQGYTPIAYSGVSSGCFIAMPAAAGYTPEEIENLLEQHYVEFNKLIFKPRWHLAYGLFTNEQIGHIMGEVCEQKGVYTMDDFPHPIVIRATNAQTGSPVYFSNLEIPGEKVIHKASPAEAIMASTAFPCFYKGVWVTSDEGEKILCTDGGIHGKLCVSKLKKALPEFEVWACTYTKKERSKAKHFLGIVKTLLSASLTALTELEISMADKVIKMPILPIKMVDIGGRHFNEIKDHGSKVLKEIFQIIY